jgi:ABC-2 type transport system permease protein
MMLAVGMQLAQQLMSAWTPQWLVDGLASLSFQTHFDFISKGVIDLRDLLYFALLIGVCLYANAIVLQLKKAD